MEKRRGRKKKHYTTVLVSNSRLEGLANDRPIDDKEPLFYKIKAGCLERARIYLFAQAKSPAQSPQMMK